MWKTWFWCRFSFDFYLHTYTPNRHTHIKLMYVFQHCLRILLFCWTEHILLFSISCFHAMRVHIKFCCDVKLNGKCKTFRATNSKCRSDWIDTHTQRERERERERVKLIGKLLVWLTFFPSFFFFPTFYWWKLIIVYTLLRISHTAHYLHTIKSRCTRQTMQKWIHTRAAKPRNNTKSVRFLLRRFQFREKEAQHIQMLAGAKGGDRE